MRHRPIFARTAVSAAAAAMLAAALLMPVPAYAQHIVAVVNGVPITSIDVSQRRAFIRLSQHKNVSAKQATDDLIDQALILKQAKMYGITTPDKEVEARFAQVAQSAHLTPEKLGQALARSGASERTFKEAIRTQLTYQTMLSRRFNAANAVSREAITKQLEASKGGNEQAYRYTLRQILFVVPTSAGARALAQRHSEAEALRRRFTSCDSGVALATGLRDVAVKPAVTRDSTQLPKEVRDTLGKTPVGHLSPPERVGEGYQVIAVCGRQSIKGGQARREEIASKLANEKFKAEAADYLKELRRTAVIQYR
jgi:peptidyl-prolyl cis-trans isomerase SurA